eukprot:1109649-Lingulodinium_polyedra.AAC.1
MATQTTATAAARITSGVHCSALPLRPQRCKFFAQTALGVGGCPDQWPLRLLHTRIGAAGVDH